MEEFIDVEQQIEKFKKEKLELIPAKYVYKLGKVHKKQYLFKHYGKQMISLIHEDEKVELRPRLARGYFSQLAKKLLN